MAKFNAGTLQLLLEVSSKTFKKELKKSVKDVRSFVKSINGELDSIGDNNSVSKATERITENFEEIREVAQRVSNEVTNEFSQMTNEIGRDFNEIQNDGRQAFNRIENEANSVNITGRLSKQINKIKSEFKSLRANLKDITVSASVTGIATGAAGMGLASGMLEDNQQLAMLETQVKNYKMSMEDIDESRKIFNSVKQDIGQVTEAMGNLFSTGYNSKEAVNQVSKSIAGAIIGFGETFTSEGIAESLNTSVKTGEMTGQFTDLFEKTMEKHKTSIDDFNAKLQSMNNEAERAKYISDFMSKNMGLGNLYDSYAENNKELIDYTNSQLEFNQSLSELAITITPVIVIFNEYLKKIIDFANANPEATRTIFTLITVFGALATALITIGGAVSGAIKIFGTLGSVIKIASLVISTVFSPAVAPIALAIGAIIGVIILLKKAFETNFLGITDYTKNLWSDIKDMFSRIWKVMSKFTDLFINEGPGQAFDYLKDKIGVVLGAIVDVVKDYWHYFSPIGMFFKTFDITSDNIVEKSKQFKDKFISYIDNAKKGASYIWENLRRGLTFTTTSLYNGLLNIFTKIKSGIVNITTTIKDSIVGAFVNLKNSVTFAILTMKNELFGIFESIKSYISNFTGGLFESGRKIIITIAEGVMSAASFLVNAVSSVFSLARNLLPFSDAKEGPFSQLTHNGSKIITTLAEGVVSAGSTLYNSVDDVLGNVNLGLDSSLNYKNVPVTKPTIQTQQSNNNANSEQVVNNITINALNMQEVRKIVDDVMKHSLKTNSFK